MPLIAAPVPLASPPLLKLLENDNITFLDLPVLEPVKDSRESLPSLVKVAPIVLLIFSLDVLLKGFSRLKVKLLSFFFIPNSPLGIVTYSSSNAPSAPNEKVIKINKKLRLL